MSWNDPFVCGFLSRVPFGTCGGGGSRIGTRNGFSRQVERNTGQNLRSMWLWILIRGPFGGHHLGGDSCPPITFEVVPIHGHILASFNFDPKKPQILGSAGWPAPETPRRRGSCSPPPELGPAPAPTGPDPARGLKGRLEGGLKGGGLKEDLKGCFEGASKGRKGHGGVVKTGTGPRVDDPRGSQPDLWSSLKTAPEPVIPLAFLGTTKASRRNVRPTAATLANPSNPSAMTLAYNLPTFGTSKPRPSQSAGRSVRPGSIGWGAT